MTRPQVSTQCVGLRREYDSMAEVLAPGLRTTNGSASRHRNLLADRVNPPELSAADAGGPQIYRQGRASSKPRSTGWSPRSLTRLHEWCPSFYLSQHFPRHSSAHAGNHQQQVGTPALGSSRLRAARALTILPVLVPPCSYEYEYGSRARRRRRARGDAVKSLYRTICC